MRTHMREQNYLDRAKLNPARAFITPALAQLSSKELCSTGATEQTAAA